MHIKQFYTVADIATECKVTCAAVRKWIHDGRIQAFNEEARYLISRDEWLYFKRVELPKIRSRRRGRK